MNINLIYDSSVNSAPTAFKTALASVAQFLDTTFTNPITINIDVGYGEIAGQSMGSGALGESETYYNQSSYTQIKNALSANAINPSQISAVASLPANDPTNGGNFWVATADAKALGLMGASSAIDGYVGFSSVYPFTYNNSNGVAPGTYDFYAVAMHELTEVMGRGLFVGTDGIGANAYTPLDLFHYSANGVRDFSGTTPGYFSVDGGKTNLDRFNTNSGGDFGDWASSAGKDAFLAFSNSGVVNAVSSADVTAMNALGYTMQQAATPDLVISSLTSPLATVSQGGTFNFSYVVTNIGNAADSVKFWSTAFLDQNATPLAGTSMQLAALASGASEGGSGSFSTAGLSLGQHTLWVEADSFNDAVGQYNSGSNDVAERNETNNWASISFTVAAVPLTLVADNPLVDGVGKTVTIGSNSLAFSEPGETDAQLTYAIVTGPADGTLLKNGSAISSFTQADIDNGLIAYRENGSNVSSDSFTFTVSDPAGNKTTTQSFALQILPVTTIESFGATWLSRVGNEYYLSSSSGSMGPVLKYAGAPVTVGQFGAGIVPIAAEQTAAGYEVAWNQVGTNAYWVWNTDLNGNDLPPHPYNDVSGSTPGLEALEPSFQQDLNGDGVLGIPASTTSTLIVVDGSTYLTQVGNEYFLENSSGVGPSLKFGGAPVTAGQFGAGIVPIAAMQTATGYEVAWEQTGANQFWVWTTDSNGNDTPPHVFNNMPGNSFAVEAIETAFNQDLNGDHTIGPPGMTVIETNGSTWLTQVGSNYFLYNSSGVGPELQYQGAPVVAGQFGAGIVPIAAEQAATGYEIAWKQTGADAYWVWNTDNNGNDLPPHPFNGVSGSTAGLEALEASFRQDLNGDGVIGVPAGSGASQAFGTSQMSLLSDQDMTAGVFSFVGAGNASMPTSSQGLATGDFLGDGNPDLLWLGSNNTPEISEIIGGSAADTIALPASPSSWRLVGGADLEGDGKSDILWQKSDGTVSVWNVNLNGTISATSPGNPGAAWQLTGTADVDGDGKSDLLFVDAAGNQEQVWLMNGTQVASVQTHSGTAYTALAGPPVLGDKEAYLVPPPSAIGADGLQNPPAIGAGLFART